ncbi:MAG: hypothetical protein KAI43_09160 [Candidatus Aureabacteria bacterium]|nr:hypothetical protein [Candidatus Auribacterota bacterium]
MKERESYYKKVSHRLKLYKNLIKNPKSKKAQKELKDDFKEQIKELMSPEGATVVAIGFTTSVGSLKGGLIGKKFPTKLNSAGKLQPYNPATGRYLSNSANVGLKFSPVGRFFAGFAQGYAEAKGASGATPVGKAGNLGNVIGNLIGNIF